MYKQVLYPVIFSLGGGVLLVCVWGGGGVREVDITCVSKVNIRKH